MHELSEGLQEVRRRTAMSPLCQIWHCRGVCRLSPQGAEERHQTRPLQEARWKMYVYLTHKSAVASPLHSILFGSAIRRPDPAADPDGYCDTRGILCNTIYQSSRVPSKFHWPVRSCTSQTGRASDLLSPLLSCNPDPYPWAISSPKWGW